MCPVQVLHSFSLNCQDKLVEDAMYLPTSFHFMSVVQGSDSSTAASPAVW